MYAAPRLLSRAASTGSGDEPAPRHAAIKIRTSAAAATRVRKVSLIDYVRSTGRIIWWNYSDPRPARALSIQRAEDNLGWRFAFGWSSGPQLLGGAAVHSFWVAQQFTAFAWSSGPQLLRGTALHSVCVAARPPAV